MVDKKPILFVFGLSASGKTTLGNRIDKEWGFLHINLDDKRADWPSIESLWVAFRETGNAGPLVAEVRNETSIKSGAVCTFRSTDIPHGSHLTSLEREGVHSLILYGAPAECLAAFACRERKIGRNLDAEYWKVHNSNALACFGQVSYEPYRVVAFQNGQPLDPMALIEIARERIGYPKS
jgi:hypothetical protein